jgi:hypothetical protein
MDAWSIGGIDPLHIAVDLDDNGNVAIGTGEVESMSVPRLVGGTRWEK